MKTIHKYPLDRTLGKQELLIPHGAKLLTVQLQHRCPMLWAEVDLNATLVPRVIVMCLTGMQLMDYGNMALSYLGTTQEDQSQGLFVQHWYGQ